MAHANLDFNSSAILKEQSSANLIVEMPGNICDDHSQPSAGRSLGVETLEEAKQSVRDLLEGRSQEIDVVSSTDKSIRKAVAEELVSSLSSANIEERERACRLFMDHGYLKEAMQELRKTELAKERAVPARALGLMAGPRGIDSLAEALFDDDPEVRSAAEQALREISGPVVPNLGALLGEELNCEVAEAVESLGMPPTVAFQETPIQNLTIPELVVEKPMSEAIQSRASEAAEAVESFGLAPTVAFQETPIQDLTTQELVVEKPMIEVTEVRASTIYLEEEAVKRAMQELERRVVAVVASRQDAENEIRLRTECVERCRGDAALRRFEDEETRRRVENEAAKRRAEEEEKLRAAQIARSETEERTQRLAQEEASLRLEFATLMQTAEGLARQRGELEAAQRAETHAVRCAEVEHALREIDAQHETELARLRTEEEEFQHALELAASRRAGVEAARFETETQIRRFEEEKAELEAAEEARQAEAERLRSEAERLRIKGERQLREEEERSRAQQEQLLSQVAHLGRVTEEVAHRRSEVEASRQRADEEGQRLMEMQARIHTTEQSRQRAAAELLWLEAEICQRTDIDQRLLEETQRRAEEQQQLIEEEARRRAEVEDQRLAELDALRQTLAAVAQERAERERQLISEVNNLRFAEVEVRKQIEQAEHFRNEAQEHYRRAVEELEKISSEAQGQAVEEEQMLGKLEYIRRQLVSATQATAQLADLPADEVEPLQIPEWEQGELAEGRKSVAVRSSR